MKLEEIITELKARGRPTEENLRGMARFGIRVDRTFCVPAPDMHKLARRVGKDHARALQLWEAGWRETRILAAMTDEPSKVTVEQMDRWAVELDSWDVCDACCIYLFSWTPLAYARALQWSEREEEYVKRAGFALMACLTVGGKKLGPDQLASFLPVIEREAWDSRNYVKKAVNWALRQVGKQDRRLNGLAIECARRIMAQGSKSARWIASDALRELTSEKVLARFRD
jgi:3-methyladenine DNA glycosylase AlkD